MLAASQVLTKKLYYDDAYQTEFEGTVMSASLIGGDGSERLLDVVTDETCFFPEEGGQSADRGILGGLEVADVQIRGGEIHHYLRLPKTASPDGARAESLISVNAPIRGKIDWEERFSNMQQHSGEHLFSGAVNRKYGFRNTGFHLSKNEVTLDFDGVIPEEDLPLIEREVNALIWRDIPSEIRMTTRSEREDLSFRSKLDLDGEVRIVTFPGADSCACCAPHVKRSGEIGILKVISMIRWKGGVRVSILCGMRALKYLQTEHEIVTEAAGLLSTARENLVPLVTKMREDLKLKDAAIKAAAVRELRLLAKGTPEGERHAVLFTETADAQSAREAVNELMRTHPGYSAVFFGSEGQGFGFVIGSASLDCREAVKILKEKLGARGGGKPEMVQGSVQAERAAIRALIEEL